jgi:RNA polymerase sigma-70 factor (ECF subfamily)
VASLPPQCRTAFTLKVFHGCSYKEIAEKLGISTKTVEHHIARGLRDTHQYLRERYGEVKSKQ